MISIVLLLIISFVIDSILIYLYISNINMNMNL